MKTQMLYLQNPYQKEFTAKVIGVVDVDEGHQGIILDRTSFYPTGGGQPHDIGYLDNYQVIDVFEQNDEVLHLIEGRLQGETVLSGRIDWNRRFEHMQQHTGQHILSAVLKTNYGWETVGFHLGKEIVTIDISGTGDLPWTEVEQSVNQIIFRNIPIETRFLPIEQLDPALIKKVPDNQTFIRFVDIHGIDSNPCRGTHPAHTGEVGFLKVLDTENYKGNIRVTFVAGWRAFERFQTYYQTLQGIAKTLKTNLTEVEERISSLRDENDQNKKKVRLLQQDLIQWEATEWKKSDTKLGEYDLHLHCWEERPFQELKELAKTIIENENQIVIFATQQPKAQVVAACSQNVDLSMVEIIHWLAPFIDGKGGGNKVFAQIGGEKGELLVALSKLKDWLISKS